MVFIIANIAVEESFGLVKAARILRECGIDSKKFSVNTFNNTIRIFIDDLEKAMCFQKIKGYTTLEIKSIFKCEKNEKTLSKLGLVKVFPVSMRVIGYVPIDDAVVLIQKTSRKGVYVATICRIRKVEIPLPPTACMFIANSEDDLKKVIFYSMLLSKLEKTIENQCSFSASTVNNH
ncbi:hypothetical protein QPL79_02100 [Ignisphaera sp. 4213-co]|uniref:Uncharacterized protein n=1 Tax=Ignisphaera cupida TaxID=3050454 RepID=A0ABD4Z5B1_9CREN|nr:hypothetical protein [Ignisphaera sp. 4213-co]MDK6028157.1 hypothetical protein [Ignisphaera sp. 4213-co]